MSAQPDPVEVAADLGSVIVNPWLQLRVRLVVRSGRAQLALSEELRPDAPPATQPPRQMRQVYVRLDRAGDLIARLEACRAAGDSLGLNKRARRRSAAPSAKQS